jgi:Fur family zinc uptake transcriptional regulator
MDAIGFEQHDHDSCISDSLQVVDAACSDRGLQLTRVRRRVIEILLQEHRAMGAYEVLDKLRAEQLGSQPPVAYRALEFLVSHGFAHKVERLNAFVACAHPGQSHAPTFLICRSCDAVVEADSRATAKTILSAADQVGFTVERMAVEVEGLCPDCAQKDLS